MRKNRLYIFFAVFTVIFLFSFSALCNQCSADNGDKIDVGGQEGNGEAAESGEGVEQSPDADSGSEDNGQEEDAGDNNGNGDGDSDDDEESEDAEIPTIELKIYEGPVYSSGDGVCYYRIRADVTGSPKPDIDFSKDDSNGAWGARKVQINLDDPSDSYTLTATATNSEGSASDSITLAWGCNRPPVVADIVVDQDFHYTGETYHVVVNTSDPDGDTLTVTWSVESGSINNVNANPMNWTTPSLEGEYDITVEVDDGNGGTTTLTKSVEVLPALPPPVFNLNLQHVAGEGGWLDDGININCPGCLYAGDLSSNKSTKGFISYDITSIAGATITDAELSFTLKQEWGDPSFFGNLYVNTIYWGENPIDYNLYSMSGTLIQGFSSSGSGNFVCDATELKEELQKAINDGKTRFQIRIHFAGLLTDNDGANDGWEYNQSEVVLNVTGSH